jgi:hypothetical protein
MLLRQPRAGTPNSEGTPGVGAGVPTTACMLRELELATPSPSSPLHQRWLRALDILALICESTPVRNRASFCARQVVMCKLYVSQAKSSGVVLQSASVLVNTFSAVSFVTIEFVIYIQVKFVICIQE